MRRFTGLALALIIAGCGETAVQPAVDDLEAAFFVGTHTSPTAGDLQDVTDSYNILGSGDTFQKKAFGGPSGRTYVRTVASDFNGLDFTATLTIDMVSGYGDGGLIFFGMGPGKPVDIYNESTGMEQRIHPHPSASGRVDFIGADALGGWNYFQPGFANTGTSNAIHTAVITKSGNQVSASFDGNAATVVADFTTVSDIDNTNSHIYFGTASDLHKFTLDIVIEASDPETKADCKKGGWVDYGFGNQGQCVRFVNTGKDSR